MIKPVKQLKGPRSCLIGIGGLFFMGKLLREITLYLPGAHGLSTVNTDATQIIRGTSNEN
jgi:hypothetical protein